MPYDYCPDRSTFHPDPEGTGPSDWPQWNPECVGGCDAFCCAAAQNCTAGSCQLLGSSSLIFWSAIFIWTTYKSVLISRTKKSVKTSVQTQNFFFAAAVAFSRVVRRSGILFFPTVWQQPGIMSYVDVGFYRFGQTFVALGVANIASSWATLLLTFKDKDQDDKKSSVGRWSKVPRNRFRALVAFTCVSTFVAVVTIDNVSNFVWTFIFAVPFGTILTGAILSGYFQAKALAREMEATVKLSANPTTELLDKLKRMATANIVLYLISMLILCVWTTDFILNGGASTSFALCESIYFLTTLVEGFILLAYTVPLRQVHTPVTAM